MIGLFTFLVLLLASRLAWLEILYWRIRYTSCDCQHTAGCPYREE
jgi:hypothetical protein